MSRSTEVTPEKGAQAEMVIVGCRHPHGIILRLYDMVDSREAAGAGRYDVVKVARPRNQTFTLNGYVDRRLPVAVDGIGMYGVTRDIPSDFFNEWMKQNADSPIVKNGIVFAATKQSDFDAIGREYKSETTGLEPLDKDKPGARFGLKKVERVTRAGEDAPVSV